MAAYFAEHGMQAYKGATVAEFPNLFFVVGPNTGLGHSSLVLMIESQVRYLVDALETMSRNDLVTVEPRAEVQQAWNAELQARMQQTVWNTGGCSSWYLDDHGRNTTLWPGTTYRFRRALRRFDPEQYVVTAASDAPTTKEKVAS
jgi:hypothetical protein